MATPALGPESAAERELAAIESAQQSAVDSTRRPEWVNALFALTVGVAFGCAMLRTPASWITAVIIFILGMTGFLIIDARLKRRRGRLLNLDGRSALRFFLVYGIIFVIGQVQPPDAWQPLFAVAAGAVVTGVSYLYLHWDDDATARKLASGDFDRSDLMP